MPTESADPEDIVRSVVVAERERMRDRRPALDRLNGLPRYDDHVNTVQKRLSQLAPPAEPPAAEEPACRTLDEL